MSKAIERRRAQNELIFDVTEDLLIAMEDAGITKAELARLTNKSKSRISQMLSGEANVTLRTLAAMCFEIGFKIDIRIGSKFSVRDPRSNPKYEEEAEFEDIQFIDSQLVRKPKLRLVCSNDEPLAHHTNWSDFGEAALQ